MGAKCQLQWAVWVTDDKTIKSYLLFMKLTRYLPVVRMRQLQDINMLKAHWKERLQMTGQSHSWKERSMAKRN